MNLSLATCCGGQQARYRQCTHGIEWKCRGNSRLREWVVDKGWWTGGTGHDFFAGAGGHAFFIVGRPGRHCSVLAADCDASLNRLNDSGDLVVPTFVTDAYRLGEVLLPIELYGAAEGLEIPSKGSVIFRPDLL